MILDALTLRVLARELDGALTGGWLRAAAVDEQALLLGFAAADGVATMNLSVDFGPPGRLRRLPSTRSVPGDAAGDVRYLIGARVAAVGHAAARRTLRLRLSRADTDGRPTYGILHLGLAPPRFRAVLVGERHGRALGVWAGPDDPRAGRRGDSGPGLDDEPPASPDWTLAHVAEVLTAAGTTAVDEALRRSSAEIDRHLAARLCADAGIDPKAPATGALASVPALCRAGLALWQPDTGHVCRWSVGPGVERISVVPPAAAAAMTTWPSVSAALEVPEAESVIPAVRRQQERLRRGLDILRRREAAVTRDLAEANSAGRLEQVGEALLAAPGRLSPGSRGTVPDVHDPTGQGAIAVELAPGESQAEHGARLLKRAARLRRRRQRLPARLHDVREILLETEALLGRLASPRASALREDEMEGWQRRAALRESPREPAAGDGRARAADERQGARPRRYRTESGWSVWAGRSNRENDILTHKIAAQNDVWFHAHGYAGSHVILRREGRKEEPSSRTLEEAAAVAAYWSKGRTANKVAVVYTLAKYVSKPRGAPPGLAVMKREKTIMVRPALLDTEEEENAP